MAYKVFVDGQAGTTGLEINERLSRRADVEILEIPEALRKSPDSRRDYLNRADVAFLCLPDDAARESVALAGNPELRLIDASTAHRVDPAWSYGLPELAPSYRAAISRSRRTAVPGCHATGFLLLAYPLVASGLLPPDYPLVCFSLSGYSGAGKKLIEEYRAPNGASRGLESPRHYALELHHKHIPEMTKHAGLVHPPLFAPVVASYYRGMTVSVPITTRLLPGKPGIEEIHAVLARHYAGERFVKVIPPRDAGYLDRGYLGATRCNGTNRVEISVHGNPEQLLLVAVLDNLGKGASGGAVQCMNLMLGLEEGLGLEA